ncbi:hypothetical protein INR49_026941 [Caranx melampygus]|nr:hypothetical protein INR49_026941 [Caranx melampygus]
MSSSCCLTSETRLFFFFYLWMLDRFQPLFFLCSSLFESLTLFDQHVANSSVWSQWKHVICSFQSCLVEANKQTNKQSSCLHMFSLTDSETHLQFRKSKTVMRLKFSLFSLQRHVCKCLLLNILNQHTVDCPVQKMQTRVFKSALQL